MPMPCESNIIAPAGQKKMIRIFSYTLKTNIFFTGTMHRKERIFSIIKIIKMKFINE